MLKIYFTDTLQLVMNPSKADMTKDFLKPTDLANSNKKTRE
jgi:hypothetical protein